MTQPQPFSIDELRANIGSDRETERMLLSLFVDSTKESLQLLTEGLPRADAAYNILWKSHMHQIKGAALNIGARLLFDLADRAQAATDAPIAEKAKIFSEVCLCFQQMEKYIRTLS